MTAALSQIAPLSGLGDVDVVEHTTNTAPSDADPLALEPLGPMSERPDGLDSAVESADPLGLDPLGPIVSPPAR